MHIIAVSEVRGYEFLWSCYLALAYILTMCTPRGTSGSEASLGNNRIGDDGFKELSNALKHAQFLVSLKYARAHPLSVSPATAASLVNAAVALETWDGHVGWQFARQRHWAQRRRGSGQWSAGLSYPAEALVK